MRRKVGSTRKTVTELQSRDLERNVHFHSKNVEPNVDTPTVGTDRGETVIKDDGAAYARSSRSCVASP
ncbi:hypothetical protein [Halalkalicoccus sp. NIPERK01]|uniref:hypothetical protein n=1 Tax=Halalkalicoccus sp. NIPERK01 TaxID=3053469 RepID=UPI00256EF730|nr:hypothetical protein [Halalkalicoccus sp. NIPERK01]MDL5363803.1 hypothetical protein [Halalkalicoccus sp. NIPERK01]